MRVVEEKSRSQDRLYAWSSFRIVMEGLVEGIMGHLPFSQGVGGKFSRPSARYGLEGRVEKLRLAN